MALSAKLQMRQTQSLVMTPQLLQSIRLLQYSQAELQSFIEAEIERNPLLEVGGAAVPEDFSDAASGPAEGLEGLKAIPALTGSDGGDAAFADGFPDADAGTGAGGGAREAPAIRLSSTPAGRGAAADDFSMDDFAEGRPSLSAHALREIAEAVAEPFDRKLAEAMAEHLDEVGYLRIDIARLAAELGVPPARLEAVLAKLQASADPAGLFARDLAECLAIQLRRQGRFDPVMAAVLAHLDLLARRDFAALRRLTGEDEAGLMDILSEIRRLDPKPGHAFDSGPSQAIVPDVLVTEAAAGGWQVELNPEALPRVLVQNDYAKVVARSGEERAFLAECQQSANWLVRSLDQRARTILKVATEIVRRQDGFLTRGVSGLRPLTLMAVAEAIGMHESTVSRVTAGKHMATPRGTFDMKFFFTVAIASSSGGDAHSAESVKHRIRAMVDAEPQEAALSDDEIAAALKREGIDLARRTVAKYREALGIASSIQRRREKNARRLAS